ncbi:hypothetical protein [Kocuria rhizophila]
MAFVDFLAPDPAFFTASVPEEWEVALSLVVVCFDEGAPLPAVPVLGALPVEAAFFEFPDVLDASAPPTEPVRCRRRPLSGLLGSSVASFCLPAALR